MASTIINYLKIDLFSPLSNIEFNLILLMYEETKTHQGKAICPMSPS